MMKPITQENDRLGFVGIGYMGRPIARRLLESGFKLIAYDRDPSKAEELIRYGGTVAQSVSELSSSCNVVLSCLPSDEAVLNIYRGPDGAFANAHRSSLVIDMSTVYPETSQELSRLGSERGRDYIGEYSDRGKGVADPVRRRRQGELRPRRVDFSGNRAKVFLSGTERFRSDDEACREHLAGNRNASDCRGRCTR